MKSLADILEGVNDIRSVEGRTDSAIEAIRYDSRQVNEGDLFVAVNGQDDTAIEFIDDAIARGATAVMLDDPDRQPEQSAGLTTILVDNARRGMAEASAAFFDYPGRRLRLFGVTGTNGKTTFTNVLASLLRGSGREAGTIGTLGATIRTTTSTGYTTPEAPELHAILAEMEREGISDVVMEVSSHGLALDRTYGLPFTGAIFTNITQDHLDFHITFQDYVHAKKRLFDRLDPEATALVNFDDVHGTGMVRDCHATVFGYGHGDTADLLIDHTTLGPDGSTWVVRFSERLGGGEEEFRSSLTGAFNVMNITAACGMGLAAGIERHQLPGLVADLRPVPGRMESIPLDNGVTGIVDYAHTPDALENLLETTRGFVGSGRLILVFGCGGDRDRGKRPEMGRIADRLADLVYVTSDNPRTENPETIIDEIVEGMATTTNRFRITDRREAIEEALSVAREGDVVVVAGKGHETMQIIGHEHRPFDDRTVLVERGRESTPDH